MPQAQHVKDARTALLALSNDDLKSLVAYAKPPRPVMLVIGARRWIRDRGVVVFIYCARARMHVRPHGSECDVESCNILDCRKYGDVVVAWRRGRDWPDILWQMPDLRERIRNVKVVNMTVS